MQLKGFYKGKELDKSATILTLKTVVENEAFYFNVGRSPPQIWKRFPSTNQPMSSWYNSAHGGDGHVLTPH